MSLRRWHARTARRAPAWPWTRWCRMTPGEWLLGEGPIALNAGRRTVELDVENTSDHTIFVSSHFPFFEVTAASSLIGRQRGACIWTSRLVTPCVGGPEKCSGYAWWPTEVGVSSVASAI